MKYGKKYVRSILAENPQLMECTQYLNGCEKNDTAKYGYN